MPNDFFYPGLPTNRQNSGTTSYNNDNLSKRQKLGVTVEQPEQPSMQGLRANLTGFDDAELSVDELLQQAYGTLDDTQANSNRLAAISNAPEDDLNASREQGRLENEASIPQIARRAIGTAAIPASFAPGPLGLVGGGVLAMEGLAAMLDPESDMTDRGMGAMSMLPIAGQAAKWGKTAKAAGAYPRAVPPVAPAAKGNFVGKEYDDIAEQVGRGFNPKAEIERVRDERASMKGLQNASNPGEVDLSDELAGLVAPPLSPRDVSQARSAERWGKTYRSEGGNPSGASSVPSASPVPKGPKPRDLSEGEERGIDELGLLMDGHGGDFPADVHPPLGRGTFKEPSVRALANPELMSALDALSAKDTASMNSVLFGGVGSRSNGGKLTRPSERTPIGKKKKR